MSAGNEIFICGAGAVSPAGWSVGALREALARGEALPPAELARPGWTVPLRVRRVPPPPARPAFLAHARLRRTSPIAQYTVAAALEALGADAAKSADGKFRLGIVFCAMSGCVNYSRRFYDEVLKDPATASPLVFPETVYNAPASHLAALIGTTAINYTLVGDPGTYLQGLALAAEWLTDHRVDGCIVIGAEEMDWLTADAMRLFDRSLVVSDGAGALYLKRQPNAPGDVRLHTVTSPRIFFDSASRARAIAATRAELPALSGKELLCDSLLESDRHDRDEASVWRNWAGARLSLKKFLGEGLTAAAAWQCVAAVDALRENHYDAATVNVAGCNEQAIAAQFVRGCTE